MTKASQKNKNKKNPKSSFMGEVLAAGVAPHDQGVVTIKPSQPIPVYEVRERKVVADRGIGQLLSQARMQWQFGEWEKLSQIDLLHIEHHPDRGELALLGGFAAYQLGEQEKAKVYLNAAEEWDCDKRLMFQLLLSGVHLSLARYNAIIGNQEKADKMLHLGGKGLGGDVNLIAEIRRKKEHSRFGLDQLTTQKSVSRLEQESEPQLEGRSEVAAEEFSMEKAIEEASRAERPFKEGITSYAQNFEDVMLWRALGHIKNGFYIDIGAQHPVVDSVSKAFYEKGWRGIHVEATPDYAKLLREDRPDEIVIEAAVSDQHGVMTFFEIPETGISTGDEHIAAMHRDKGFPVKKINVPTLTLADIFALAGDREIHWLKIDVEGMEKDVLAGWGNAKQRPWIVVVESTVPNSVIDVSDEWCKMLVSYGYEYTYFDGLSKYYISKEKLELLENFKIPPNVFDKFNLKTYA